MFEESKRADYVSNLVISLNKRIMANEKKMDSIKGMFHGKEIEIKVGDVIAWYLYGTKSNIKMSKVVDIVGWWVNRDEILVVTSDFEFRDELGQTCCDAEYRIDKDLSYGSRGLSFKELTDTEAKAPYITLLSVNDERYKRDYERLYKKFYKKTEECGSVRYVNDESYTIYGANGKAKEWVINGHKIDVNAPEEVWKKQLHAAYERTA